MTRRELLTIGKNSFIFLFYGAVLGEYGFLGKKMVSTARVSSQLAFFLGYLLYDEHPPEKEVEEIENHLNSTTESSFIEKLKMEWVYRRIGSKHKREYFETLSADDKRNCFKEIMPILAKSSVISKVLQRYFQGEKVLTYLDYPDLPGDYSECGYIVTEGAVWDRYYPLDSTREEK